MSVPFPEPTEPVGSTADVFLGYLSYFRAVVIEKLDGLDERELRNSCLPSGWTPLELVRHLTFVERRWLQWGFEGEPMAEPWGDSRDGRWFVGADEPAHEVLRTFVEQAAVTRDVVASHALTDVGVPGPRWDGAPPPTLARVLFHLVQEYARHVGHMDIVRELIDGIVGE